LKDVIEKQEMKIGSLVAWFGGKRTLAPTIVSELGAHSMYVEPFCGSMAVLLAKPPCSHDIVNDLHGDLINLARVIASDRWEELYNRLYRTLCSEDIFKECKVEFLGRDIEPPKTIKDVADEHIERAYIYFVVSWIGRNGTSGTKRQNHQPSKRWTPGGGSGGVRFASAVDSIRAWHERLRRVNIMNMDGFELIEKVEDSPMLAMYVDPPYMMGGARTGGSGSGKYEHEFGQDDHNRLAELLGRFKKARVIVSYYDDERVDGLYPSSRWTKRKVYRMKGIANGGARGYKKTEAPEVLLINGESLAPKEKGLFG
jgi:DNA adenine methylase